jgi:superfamily II RNA helicase
MALNDLKCPAQLQDYLDDYTNETPQQCINYIEYCMDSMGSSIYGNPRNHQPPSPKSEKLGFKFELDKWQYDLVDAVNHKLSVLVRAPTSSGKTFIAIYAMEKYSKMVDSVVVFVWYRKQIFRSLLQALPRP